MYRLIGHVILVTILYKKSCLFGKSKLTRKQLKVNLSTMVEESLLMEQMQGSLGN